MALQDFNSSHMIDVKAGFDASKLKGKSVVVTGGASGLGEEMVRQFVKAGAFVTIGDLSEERSASIVDELGKDNCTYSATDVLSWSSQLTLFKHAIATSPTSAIDVVIANAGISGHDDVWRDDKDTNPSEPQEPDLSILKVNIVGVHYTVKLAEHYLAKNTAPGADRVLIMTASLAGFLDMPGAPQYGASKWAVRGLMHSLRRTMPAQNMRVNLIAPWFIQTRILDASTVDYLTDRGVHFAEKSDAAKAVLHFAADSSINGRTFAILPRDWEHGAKEGYEDLGLDDFNEGERLTLLQKGPDEVRHRIKTS